MGKKKNKNKVSGAVKTAAKTEKKLANKLKKELANLGEEDIAKVIAEIEREEAKRSAASEKTLPGPPSARAYASLTPHPITNELILFGGEYHNGQKTEVYNELLLYNPDKGSWKQVRAPGAPPPRSAHQAVATSANKGELWVFGGEFTSPSETQFHHYKDLWCFSLADKKWEKVACSGGPSARSGHRMALLGRRLLVFGGYSDDARDCRYYSDVHVFCLESRAWTALSPAGPAPAPRSACILLPHGNDAVYVYGGFSRERVGRTEHARTHCDQFRLSAAPGGGGGGGGIAWRGRACPPGAPPPRAAQAAALAHNNRAYVFGGVADVEETEEQLRGELSAELHCVELESGHWHRVTLRGDAAHAVQAAAAPREDAADTVISENEGFTLRVGGAAPLAAGAPDTRDRAPDTRGGGPCARMSAMLAVQRGTLYVYGGLLEKDDKQFYLGDMYSLDINKLIEWKTIIPQPELPAWLGSDSEDDDDDSDDSDDSSDSSDHDD